MRRLICLASFVAVVLVGVGCSSSHNKQASVMTFSQYEGGNIAAGDALGSNLSMNQRVQMTFVPPQD